MLRSAIGMAAALVLLAAAPALAQLTVVDQFSVDTFPGGIAYDSDRDHIWLVNDSSNEVREYTRKGTLVQTLPGGPIGMALPIGIDFNAMSTNLWICDETISEAVFEVTRDGALVSSFSVDADMADASALAINTTDGNLYIADDNSSEVVSWSTDGTLIARFSTAPMVTDADAICYVSEKNTLLVGDDTAAEIHEFTPDGTYVQGWDLSTIGIEGCEGLAFDVANGILFVADSTIGAQVIYEVEGIVMPTPTEDVSWGGIKSRFVQ